MESQNGVGQSHEFKLRRDSEGNVNDLCNLILNASKSSHEFTSTMNSTSVSRNNVVDTWDSETVDDNASVATNITGTSGVVRKRHKSHQESIFDRHVPTPIAFDPSIDYVCEVQIRAGRKILQVRSGVKILNFCAMDIQFEFQDTPSMAPRVLRTGAGFSGSKNSAATLNSYNYHNQSGSNTRKRTLLRHGRELCVPLHLLANNAQIRLRPVVTLSKAHGSRTGSNKAFRFSKSQSIIAFLGSTHREFTFHPNQAAAECISVVSVNMSVETDSYGQRLIRLSPTLTVTNLVPLSLRLRTCVVNATLTPTGSMSAAEFEKLLFYLVLLICWYQ